MDNILALVLIPILTGTVILAIEYWVIQPLKDRTKLLSKGDQVKNKESALLSLHEERYETGTPSAVNTGTQHETHVWHIGCFFSQISILIALGWVALAGFGIVEKITSQQTVVVFGLIVISLLGLAIFLIDYSETAFFKIIGWGVLAISLFSLHSLFNKYISL